MSLRLPMPPRDQTFTTFISVMQAIGYSPTSVIGYQTIDTGKVLGGLYIFYSFLKLSLNRN